MKNVKQIISCLAVAAFLLCAFGPTIVEANNCQNWVWGYEFVSGNNYKVTLAYEKMDDSSTYFEFNSGTLPYIYFAPMGVNTQSSYGGTNCKYATGGLSGSYQVYQGNTNHYFTNYVYERGFQYCYLQIYSIDIWGTAYGVWSPDSV